MDAELRRLARDARAAIDTGTLRGEALRRRILAVPLVDRDAFVDELLRMEPPPPDEPLPRGAVPYLPCGITEVLAMIADAPITRQSELVDIGSGLGRVALVVHLVTGARVCGIEIQKSLVERATALRDDLGLRDVRFVHGNAAEQELDGSVFFLYAPCNGEMLARVTERLASVARRRPIAVGAVGLELDDVPWLVRRASSCVALALYKGRPPA